MLDHRGSSLKPRLPDKTYNYLVKVLNYLSRILDLVLMNLNKWVKVCIMQLPNTRTKLTIKSTLVQDYLKLQEDQQSMSVQQAIILRLLKISTKQVDIH